VPSISLARASLWERTPGYSGVIVLLICAGACSGSRRSAQPRDSRIISSRAFVVDVIAADARSLLRHFLLNAMASAGVPDRGACLAHAARWALNLRCGDKCRDGRS